MKLVLNKKLIILRPQTTYRPGRKKTDSYTFWYSVDI